MTTDRARNNILLNLASGFLGAFGAVSFCCFFYLVLTWAGAAPGSPQPDMGLTLPNNSHGRITYWSAFQSMAAFLLLFTSVPLIALGAEIGPKKTIRPRSKWSVGWDRDDPARMLRWGLLLGALAAPAFLFLAGPAIVDALLASGIRLTLG